MGALRDHVTVAFSPVPLALAAVAFAVGYQVRGMIAPVVIVKDPSSARSRGHKRGTSSSASAASAAGAGAQATRAAAPGVPATKPMSASTSTADWNELGSDSEWSGSEDETDPESDLEDRAQAKAADLASVKAKNEELKLVIVVNDSLKMNKGKIAAQASHATLACYETLAQSNPKLLTAWKRQGQPKIVTRCKDTQELNEIAKQARQLNLCARTITDAGRTQVAAGSRTVCGIGPGPANLVNQVTRTLRLL